jgi:DNA recombination protein RmuC
MFATRSHVHGVVMAEPILPALLVLLALLLGLALGWWLASRPLAALRAERDAALAEAADAREKRSAAAVEVVALTRRAEELAGAERAREGLTAQLEGLRATQAERDRAHAAELLRLNTQFEQLAGKALAEAQKQLAENAEQMLARHREAAGQGLEASRTQLHELLTPVKDTLARYETRLGEVEKARTESYGQLGEALRKVLEGQDKVSGATLRLETALRSSGKVAGRWGEEQCRNVLEAAGLQEGIDFESQFSMAGEDGRQRPDFIIKLPGGRCLIVDVKCSINDYVSAAETDDPVARQTLLAAHARAIRAHADGLAKKDYAKSLGHAVDFVVLFVPGENFLSAAIEQDRGLLVDFFNKRVVLAGPVNLVAVARTIGTMRDQARLAQEAQEIARLGRDLYDSLRIMGNNFGAVQAALERTVGGWNKLVSQMESRVMLRARRFRELGVGTGMDDIAEIAAVAQTPLLPGASEFAAEPGQN